MIPKIIYTTWVSNKPFPEAFRKYLDSWKKFMPDYDIRIINIDNVGRNKFIDDAIDTGKYVIAGHWGRVQKLYETGGIYCDIDIEAIKNFDEFLDKKFFIGTDGDNYINNAIFGAEAGHPFLKDCLDYMENFDVRSKEAENETGPRMFTNIMKRHGWNGVNENSTVGDITVYNNKYFYPFNWNERFSESCIKPETTTIHWWGATWVPKNGISVIIPCYNQAHLLSKAIESAMKLQTKHEIIVVNDGSTDNTSEVAKRYLVKLIEKENGGVSTARNEGVRQAEYNIILPLDADDELIPESIDKVIHNFDYDADVIYGNMIVGDAIIKPNYGIKYEDFLRENQIYQCSLYRKSIWDKLEGYWKDKKYKDIFEDWDFYARAAKIGFKFMYVDVPFYKYNELPDSMTNRIKPNREEIINLVKEHIKNA